MDEKKINSEKPFSLDDFSASNVFNKSSSHLTSNNKLENVFADYFKKSTSLDYLVSFSKQTENYCIGLVDMVNSTKISAVLNSSQMSKYYQTFLNSMSQIITRFGGIVVKNIGDCLLYYFPQTTKQERKFGFVSCLECSLAMIELHETLCKELVKDGLPCLNYRVSVDYGPVLIMKSTTNSMLDMIGTPVNICAKINKSAPKNRTVIGGDLHELVKHFDEYNFKEIKGFSLGFKQSYPVYLVTRRHIYY